MLELMKGGEVAAVLVRVFLMNWISLGRFDELQVLIKMESPPYYHT